jgi:hypothetical protein
MRIFKRVTIFMLLISIFAIVSLSSAQEPTQVPLRDWKTTQCEANFQEQAEEAALELGDIQLSDFTSVYLVSVNGLTKDNALSAQNVASSVKDVKVVTTWDDLLAIDKTTPIDTVFIHVSALDIADQTWFQDAFRKGVQIVTINFTFGQRAELLNDYCSFRKYAADGPLNGNPMTANSGDFYIQSLWILRTDEDISANVSQAELLTCDSKAARQYAYKLNEVQSFEGVQSIESLVSLGKAAGYAEFVKKVDALNEAQSACTGVVLTN